MRDAYTWTRNRCTQARRCGLDFAALEDMALHFQRQYHRNIRDAKRRALEGVPRHYRQHLEGVAIPPAVEPIYGDSPTLCSGELTFNHDQGRLIHCLETFSPLPSIQDETPRDRSLPDALPVGKVTEHEIEVALMRMASWKAPGPAGLPVVVWQKVWSTVK